MRDPMRDPIFESFLARQADEALRLSASSDIVTVLPIDPQRYVLHFCARGLVLDAAGVPRVHDEFGVAICFPPDYVRVEHHPGRIIQWLGPATVFHPNIRPPFVCLGPIAPGEGLIDLAYRLFEVIAFHRVSPHDPLNAAAAQWVRNHQDELPLDRRTLLRPTPQPAMEERRVTWIATPAASGIADGATLAAALAAAARGAEAADARCWLLMLDADTTVSVSAAGSAGCVGPPRSNRPRARPCSSVRRRCRSC